MSALVDDPINRGVVGVFLSSVIHAGILAFMSPLNEMIAHNTMYCCVCVIPVLGKWSGLSCLKISVVPTAF